MYKYCAIISHAGDDGFADHVFDNYSDQFLNKNYSVNYKSRNVIFFTHRLNSSGFIPMPLSNNGGIIFGTIFNSKTSSKFTILNDEYSEDILNYGPEYFSKLYWGRYIGIIDRQDKVEVFRDPSGGIECFIFKHEHYTFVFSNPNVLRECIDMKFDIDWGSLPRFLMRPDVLMKKTGLLNVEKILPGHKIDFRSIESEKTKFWSIADFWDPSQDISIDESKYLLEESVKIAVNSWSSIYSNILLRLSGGLDSSIISGCLSGNGQKNNIFALNYIYDSSESDERYYAREVAKFCQIKLIEVKEDIHKMNISDALYYSYSAEPRSVLPTVLRSKGELNLAEEFNSKVIINGTGGDAIFGQYLPRVSEDCFVAQGISREFLKIAYEEARIYRRSIWSVIENVISSLTLKNNINSSNPIMSEFEDCIYEILGSEWHQTVEHISENDDDLLGRGDQKFPSKNIHLRGIMAPYWDVSPEIKNDYLDTIYPLVSQPILEAAARIPSYYLIYGGLPRGLARAAFGHILPDDVRCRVSKGGISNLFDSFFLKESNKIKEIILDGVLIKNGIINKIGVEKAFNRGISGGSVRRQIVMSALSIELWCRYWSES